MTWAHKAGERLRAMRSDEGALDALIALLHWLRGDRVERPWRLTRRQRVEMEAALSRLREDVIGGAHRGPCAATGDGWRLLCGVSIIPYDYRMTEGEREAEDRIQALRVAIALRAALRADEDARCEEAYAAAGCPAWGHADLGDVLTYDEGALAALDLLREWPGLARDLDTGRVQLALWEVVR